MCKQCQALRINGVLCHEHGCPDAWKDYQVNCKWCGQEFKPETRHQICCSDECMQIYYGF